ncbi:MAG TPA: hypothetical protein PK812_03330 [Beijerinckiaceae bacterium]|nr:hypothetical protein [Beijerinckiaceae bacterium]
MFEQLLKLTGLANMNSTHQLILVSVVVIIVVILGFMTDSLLRSSGFGPVGNAAVIILGIVGGAIIYTLYLQAYRHPYPFLPVAAPIVGGFSLLLVMAILKALMRRE